MIINIWNAFAILCVLLLQNSMQKLQFMLFVCKSWLIPQVTNIGYDCPFLSVRSTLEWRSYTPKCSILLNSLEAFCCHSSSNHGDKMFGAVPCSAMVREWDGNKTGLINQKIFSVCFNFNIQH